MAQEYVPIFFDWTEVTGELTAQEKGRLIDAIVMYAQGGDWQEQIKGNERYLFPAFKRQIDRARETSGKRAVAGAVGAKNKQTETNASKPKQTEANVSKRKQTEANASKSAKEKEKEKEKEYDKEYDNEVKGDEVPPTPPKAQKRFTAPTVEEVAAYCRERGNRVEAQRFVDFYTAKGWRVGSSPMKDWRAAVRNWETRDNAPMPTRAPKVVTAQCYTQREYTEDEMRGSEVDIFAAAKELQERGTG